MKRNILTCLMAGMILGGTTASAQETSGSETLAQQQSAPRLQSVMLELGGMSNGIGLNYEYRLPKHPEWGLRAGLSWGYSNESVLSFYSGSERSYTVPLGVNYLLGKRRSKLEIGTGVNLGIYNTHAKLGDQSAKENNFAYYCFAGAGYRYQGRNGFQFRTGLGPVFNLGGKHTTETGMYVYLSFGWAF